MSKLWFPALLNMILFAAAAASVFPFVHMLAVSLSQDAYVIKGDVFLWPKGLNFDMFVRVLSDRRIELGYRNSLIYVTVGTFISLLVTAMGAYALSKKEMLFHKTFTIMIMFAMLFTGGMIPTYLVVKSVGILNTMWAMVLPGAVSIWNLIIMRTFFISFPREIEESARMDGMNDIRIFLYLVLPLSKASLATIGLFYGVRIWNDFFSSIIYLQDANLSSLQLVVRNIVLMGDNQSREVVAIGGKPVVEQSLKYTVIVVSTLPILLVSPFLQKYFAKGALIGATKG